MKLFFFGILVASRKHKTFADIHGDVMCDDDFTARKAAFEYAQGIERKSGGDLFAIGIVTKPADLVVVTPDVRL